MVFRISNYKHMSTVMFLASVMVFPQSYVAIKLFFLANFLLAHGLSNCLKKRIPVYFNLIVFYVVVSVFGAGWALVGVINGGDLVGIGDAIRLYVIWSWAFVVIFTFIRAADETRSVHNAIVLSGIVICLINFFGLCDYYFQFGLIDEAIKRELDLFIGFHDGYIQITSQNIGSLFVIIPYLLSIQFRNDVNGQNAVLTKISLILTLALAAMSGRRALWLILAFSPVVIGGLSYVAGSLSSLKRKWFLFLKLYICGAMLLLGVLVLIPNILPDIGLVRHLNSAFSPEDERSIQKSYLVDSFSRSPFFGSGFGVGVGYIRNEQRPWLYELTYHQMLFNVGIIGTFVSISLFCCYFLINVSMLRRNKSGTYVEFGIFVSTISLLIAAYSNPYLGSFDFLLLLGLFPYLSTFRNYTYGPRLRY